ncbi:protein DOG1-like 4 [Juglans microcarpa x Juglans regia]|uniref:protein DOG1-like 4 n=1 Tax=Juglans microcarpa x Juglans regia TaxID=2249226 RepID=UPI001B7F3082|nr:protein DOG1-like 4 [Juglans microcarpa x Juglans regia]XP_041028663.1 protein DOG1-like 4 [Juglans microcarpa x Juglans regia]
MNNMKTQVEEKFSEFFEKWVCQLEEHVQLLLSVSKEKQNEAEVQALVSRVTSHYKEYYTVKWAGAHEDVLAFFTPVWLSPLENVYLWITDWKPSMAFQVIDALRIKTMGPRYSLVEMSEQQVKKIEDLRVKTRLEKEKVEREMERQQVSMADRRMVELARLASRVKEGDVVGHEVLDGLVEVALKELLKGLERVVKGADGVRLKALMGVLEVLSPRQSVDFLAAILTLQIRLRQRGKKRNQNDQADGILVEPPKLV